MIRGALRFAALRATLFAVGFLVCAGALAPAAAGQQDAAPAAGAASPEPQPAAATTSAVTTSDVPTRETLQAALALLEGADPGLEGDALARATSLRRQALIDWDRWNTAKSRLPELQRSLEVLPEELSRLKAQLAQEEVPPAALEPGLTLDELELRLQTAREVREQAEAALTAHREQIAARDRRRTELPDRLAAASQELGATEVPLDLPEGIAPRLREAELDARTVRRAKAEAELASLRVESQYLAAMPELSSARTRLLERELARAQAGLAVVQQRRDAERERAAARASRAAERADPLLEPLAEEVALLAGELSQLSARRVQIDGQRTDVRTSLTDIVKRFQSTQERVDIGGFSSLNGILLRQERARLPNINELRAGEVEHQKALARRQLRLQEVEENLAVLEDSVLEEYAVKFLDERVAEEPISITEAERVDLLQRAEALLANEQELLGYLRDELVALIGSLEALESLERSYIEEADSYALFINERVLWVRSAAPLWRWKAGKAPSARDRVLARRTSEVDLEPANEVQQLFAAAACILSPTEWTTLLNELGRDFQAVPVLWVLALLLFVGLSLARRSLRKRLAELAGSGSSIATARYEPLAAALALTFLLALPAPFLLAFAGWRMDSLVSTHWTTLALAQSLPRAALLLFGLEFVRRSCRPHGLAEAHLGWDAREARRLWRSLIVFTWPFLLAYVVVRVLDGHPEEAYGSTLGRLVFLFEMFWLAFFAHQFTLARRPSREDEEGEPAAPKGGAANRPLLRRLAVVWSWTALLSPLLLAGLSIFGYELTAHQLLGSLLQTLMLLAGLFLVQAVALRLVEITKRRVAVQRLRRSLEAKRDEDEGFAEEEGYEETAANLSVVSLQVRQLVASAIGLAALVGVYLIWIDVIPALGIFRTVKLWSVQGTETLLPKPGEAVADALTRDVLLPVTLSDLLASLFAAAVALVAARRVPAVLDLLVLERLRMTGGERYAFTTVLRYVITLVGVLVSLSFIRIGWGQVQFLAAAISVGLGFGLQEIFANFVSGLILLFERPIRLGDWITIGDQFGKVTRIQIRATTLLDRDLREVVVPNKEFVTSKLVNWTLTDSETRVMLPVGIAYGSDVQLALKTLTDVATRTADVLDDPAPRSLFVGFGDNSLNLRLDAYLPDQTNYWPRISRIYEGIDKAFRQAKLEIAFPQRDLHIRSAPALAKLWETSPHAAPPAPAAGPAPPAAT